MDIESILDKTLICINKHGSIYNIKDVDIEFQKLLKELDIGEDEFIEVLQILKEDGYADFEYPKEYDIKDIRLFLSVNITIKGRYFYSIGGYKGKRIKQEFNKEQEIKNNRISNLLSGTIGALLGALIGLVGQCQQKQPEQSKHIFPTIQIVHDTIYKEVQKDK